MEMNQTEALLKIIVGQLLRQLPKEAQPLVSIYQGVLTRLAASEIDALLTTLAGTGGDPNAAIRGQMTLTELAQENATLAEVAKALATANAEARELHLTAMRAVLTALVSLAIVAL